MDTEAHCQRLAAWLTGEGLRASVALRMPKAARAGIVVWPYATSPDPASQNALPTRDAEGRVAQQVPSIRTHVLLLPGSLAAYDRASALVRQNPMLVDGLPPLQLGIEPLSVTELTALFLAAGVEFRLSLPLLIA